MTSGSDITVTHNGYLYVWVSNESKGNVYFDDIRVEHQQGPLLEENHYYPYGLKMAALCSKAFGSLLNKFQYQGSYSEFDEETGYNEFALRNYDPQLGRWTGVDPYDEFPNPYTGIGNDPINNVDPNGGGIGDVVIDQLATAATGFVAGAIVGALTSKGGKKWLQGGLAGAGAALLYEDVPWNNVFSWFGGLFSNDWSGFYKADLIKYVESLGKSTDDNTLGEEFENIFDKSANDDIFSKEDLERSRFRQAKNTWKDSKVRNSKPDFVADDFYDESDNWIPDMKRVEEGSAWEVKQNNGKGIYLSSNDNQIKGHILNLAAKHATDMATGKYHPSLTLVTTYDVSFSPKTLLFATLNGVQYTQSRSKFKIVNGHYKFKFVNFNSNEW